MTNKVLYQKKGEVAYNAHRALAVNMVSKVVPHDELMGAAEDMAARILRNDRRAVESAKETIFEVIGRARRAVEG